MASMPPPHSPDYSTFSLFNLSMGTLEMTPILECVPTLFCTEDDNGLIGWDDEIVNENVREETRVSDCMGVLDLPSFSDESIEELVMKERDFLPQDDYVSRFHRGVLDASVRGDAIDWIWKVHAHYNFNPLTAYLAVNYLDRFLSGYELPRGKAWMMQLLCVACLSLAAKMEETEVPLSIDLQLGEAKFVFESRTIQRMELLVLSTLKWKMKPVTPFSFIDHFLRRINNGKEPPPQYAMISRSVDLILITIRGINFLEFRPFVIAAATAISVSEENESVDFSKAMSRLPLPSAKQSIWRCYEIIHDVILMRNPNWAKKSLPNSATSSAPQSPNRVLNVTCLSYKSEEANNGSCDHFPRDSPVAKRRRLTRSNEAVE